jgi:type IV pilus assembly protein PilC
MGVKSTFAFRAREVSGDVVTGTMVAETADEVGARLRSEGKYVIAIDDRPLRERDTLDADQIRLNEAAKRVRREDVIAFSLQLSTMLETGVPLAEALDSFCRQTTSREFKQVLEVLREDVYSGENFSTAMAKWPRVFPSMMISLMKASEASGTMDMMLGRVGEYLQKERRTVRQIKGALSYPMFMMGAGVLLSVFLMIFILPRFAKVYDAREAALPVPTKVLLTISQVITGQYLVYVPVLVVLLVAGTVFLRTDSGRWTMDWLRLHVPGLRQMYAQLYLTRAARTMSTLMVAGVNLLDIIEICRGVTNNRCFNVVWDEMEVGVREGRQMSDACTESPYIPPNIASMISSGERSGRLGQVMERIAAYSEDELDTSVKQVTAYIEPIMIMGMGVVVGGVAISLLLPIFKMSNVMSG